MSKASPALTNFNSGEFSPLLDGRVDFDRYANGCTIMENFIPTVQGPAIRRGGTRYVAPLKAANKKAWLVPFEYSETQAYVLEFGDLYIRFFTQNGQLVSGWVPVEVVTPYTLAGMFNADGTTRMRFAQSGDFLYITHPDHAPRILKRLTGTSFSLVPLTTKGGPFKDIDPDQTITVSASAVTGTVTLTASSAIFLSGHVGTKFLLEANDTSAVPMWEPSKYMAGPGENVLGKLRRSDGKFYECVTNYTVPGGGVEARTGVSKPVHSRGVQADGDGEVNKSGSTMFANRQGVEWLFLHAGYGWVQITAIGGGGTTATATVISRLPAECVGANATTRWAFSAWSDVEGWPTAVGFHRERLCFARGQKLWMSVAAAFDDFSARNDSGEVVADMAVSLEMASGEINEIQWLQPDRELIAGTAGGEFIIGELQNGDPLGPGNVRVRLTSRFGCRAVPPIANGSAMLFLMRAGLKVRELAYDFASDGYQSKDATNLSDHITKGGLIDMDFALEPYSVVWCVRADGELVGFTWNVEEGVKGWHRHPLGGDGKVESVAVIPRPDGSGDQVWLIVRRTINGATARYVEYLEDPLATGGLQVDAFYVDSGLTYAGAPATVISGLDHLEGCTVQALADGSPVGEFVVASGSITLPRPASKVQIGLYAPAVIQTMRLEAGAQDGTSQGKTKRIHKMTFRLKDAACGKVGPNAGNLTELQFRTSSDPMDAPPPLYTGDKLVSWPGGYETDARVYFLADKPTPITLVAIYPQVVTNDSR